MKIAECAKLSMSKIKKTKEYMNIPRKYGKSKLTKEELCIVIEKLTEKKTPPKKEKTPEGLKVRGSAEKKYKKELSDVVSDLSMLKKEKMTKSQVRKMMKKYHLPTQEQYLKEKISIKLYLRE